MTLRLTVLLALAVVGCSEDGASPDAPKADAPPRPAGDAPALDERDQYELVREMLAADDLAYDADDPSAAYIRVGSGWRGRRYTWEMMRIDALCRDAESCLFAPFDHGRFDRSINYAFLPRARFDEAGYTQLDEACRPHAPECVVRLEATLATLVVEPGSPVRIELADPRVVEARRRDETEQYMSRPVPRVAHGSALRGAFAAAVRTKEER
jgi:hypothetical protein